MAFHFRFLKIPVYIDLSFWIFLLFVMRTTGLPYRESILLVIVLACSLFLHEYGHALAALLFDADPVIVLHAFGGKTRFNTAVITDKQRILIIFAGPLLQGLVALVAYLLFQCNFLHYYIWSNFIFATLYYINIIWLLLNLMPIVPFDGGWLVRYILEKKLGRKGYRISLIIGLVVAAIVIPYCLLNGCYFFFIMQLLISGFEYCKLWQREQELTNE